MLELRVIREHKAEIAEKLKVRNGDFSETLDAIETLDDKRKSTQASLDALLAEQNSLAKEIGGLFKSGKQAEANVLKEKTGALKAESNTLKETLADIEKIKNLCIIFFKNA